MVFIQSDHISAILVGNLPVYLRAKGKFVFNVGSLSKNKTFSYANMNLQKHIHTSSLVSVYTFNHVILGVQKRAAFLQISALKKTHSPRDYLPRCYFKIIC